ncbi:50S ribosomal protein L9 [Candidatus Poriferisocius sp.]|uniref:50S ribosomal protein L9 n=1 Tax=Candidatus Poriferisocius sp. TaxID=3101276 RepID=UPI003B5ADE1E
MKVVLRDNVDDLGKKGDVVDVADGYARNFLIPAGKAFRSSAGAERQAERMRRSRELKDAKERAEAQEMATRLVSTPIHIAARAGAEGKLFGSVTTADIVRAVAEQANIMLERKAIEAEAIKELGSHVVTAKPHPEVEFPITVEVLAAD